MTNSPGPLRGTSIEARAVRRTSVTAGFVIGSVIAMAWSPSWRDRRGRRRVERCDGNSRGPIAPLDRAVDEMVRPLGDELGQVVLHVPAPIPALPARIVAERVGRTETALADHAIGVQPGIIGVALRLG